STSTSSSTTDRGFGLSGFTGEAKTLVEVFLLPNACHGSCPSTAVYGDRHRRCLCAGRSGDRADLPCHECGEFRTRRILDGRRLSDGGVRRRSWLALLAVIPDRAGRHGAARGLLQSRGILPAAASLVPPRDHRH